MSKPKLPRLCSVCQIPIDPNTRADRMECPAHKFYAYAHKKVVGKKEPRNTPFGTPMADIKPRSGKSGFQLIHT